MTDLTRPIIGIENRTAQEAFDIMCDRIRRASPAPAESGAVAWMKDVGGNESDLGPAYDECLVVAAKGDPGAFPVYTHPSPAPSASMGRVTVKALQWREEVSDLWWCADAYRVEAFDGGGWAARVADPQSRAFRTLTFGVSLEWAKSACQSHYEARILAALGSPPDHGGGEGDAVEKVADRCHPSHVTRISMDASSYDEICVNCGATDHIGGWGNLAKPCPHAAAPTQESKDGR